MNRTMLMRLAATTLVAGGSLFAQSQPTPPAPPAPPDAPAIAPAPSAPARVAPSEAKLRAMLAEVAALLDKEDLTDEERAKARKKLAQAMDRLKARDGVPLTGLFVPRADGDPVVVRGRAIDGEAPATVLEVRGREIAEVVAPSADDRAATPAPAAPALPPVLERHERRVAELRAKIDGIQAELDGMSAKGQTKEPRARYFGARKAAEEAEEQQRKAAGRLAEADKLLVRAREGVRVAEVRDDIVARVREGVPIEPLRLKVRRPSELDDRTEAQAAPVGETELRALIEEMRAEMREIRSLVRQLREGTEQAEAGQYRVRGRWSSGASGDSAAGSRSGGGGGPARASSSGSSNRRSATGFGASSGPGRAAGSKTEDDGEAPASKYVSRPALRWNWFPGGDQPAGWQPAERLFYGYYEPKPAASAERSRGR